jgi:dolichol-phosphate mannosyltransferase
MRHSEPKSGLCDLRGSVLAATIFDECNLRLAGIALLIIVTDVLACEILIGVGIHMELSQVAALFIAATLGVTLGAGRLLPQSLWQGGLNRWTLFGAWSVFVLLTLLLRSSVLLALLDKWHWLPRTAIIVAALLGDSVGLAGVFLFVFAYSESSVRRWPVLAAGIVSYTFVLKLIFLGYLNLIPEEAYYWNYARHLDIGYLDHPPMVAWLIWLSTSIFGKSEFSVRLPAFLCWLAAAAFMFRLTRDLCDRSTAYRSAMLLAVLPIYFGLGFFMTPDAPLFATWAGSLYFLERALITQERRPWRWIGVCIGLGMLSKYPTALLSGATVIFLIIDRKSRHWLVRPEPYLAAITAFVLFSPVLLWNMQNNWMSFAFQGTNRWSGSHHFSFHVLIGSILLLLTPMGLLGIGRVLLPGKTDGLWRWQTETKKRQYFWAVTFTLVPLSVFVLYSFFNTPKLNWTAPVWLAAIPLLASEMVSASVGRKGVWAKLNRFWMPTIVALIFIHSASFYYISLGLPGAGPMSPERLFGDWRGLAEKVGKIRSMVEVKNGTRPVVVGMDKNFISSELSFYGSINDYGTTGGAHLFGQRSLMWAVWFPPSAALGKDILMIDFDRKRIMSPKLSQYFETLGDVSMESLEHNGRVVGHFYWRVGRAYRSLKAAS